MALIKCNECNKEISDTTKLCPHCGGKTELELARINSRSNLTKITIVAIVIIGGLIAMVSHNIKKAHAEKFEYVKRLIIQRIENEQKILDLKNIDTVTYPAMLITQEREMKELTEENNNLSSIIEPTLKELNGQ